MVEACPQPPDPTLLVPSVRGGGRWCRALEESISTRREAQLDLIGSLQHLVPDLVPSLDQSLRLVAAFNGRPFVPTLYPNASAHPQHPSLKPHHRRALADPARSTCGKTLPGSFSASASAAAGCAGVGAGIDAVRTMVAVCLLELVPFAEIDAAVLARRLLSETLSASEPERAALADLAAELGGSVSSAVAHALRRNQKTAEPCRSRRPSLGVHLRRIIAPHTDTNLGDCSFLDTCCHTKCFSLDHRGVRGCTRFLAHHGTRSLGAAPRLSYLIKVEMCS